MWKSFCVPKNVLNEYLVAGGSAVSEKEFVFQRQKLGKHSFSAWGRNVKRIKFSHVNEMCMLLWDYSTKCFAYVSTYFALLAVKALVLEGKRNHRAIANLFIIHLTSGDRAVLRFIMQICRLLLTLCFCIFLHEWN